MKVFWKLLYSEYKLGFRRDKLKGFNSAIPLSIVV